jgi:hypothetical protein
MPVSYQAAHLLTERGLESIYNPSSGTIEFTWKSDAALTLPPPWPMTAGQTYTFLSNLKCPVLFVFGTQGYFDLKAEEVQSRLKQVKRKSIFVVPGANFIYGHNYDLHMHAIAQEEIYVPPKLD